MEIIFSSRSFVVGIHAVIAGEDTRDVDAFWAGHTVSASGTVYFGSIDDYLLDACEELEFSI